MVEREVLKRHAALVDQMAKANDMDLQQAVLDGTMRFEDIADAVLNCVDCSNPDHCSGLLDSMDQLEKPPGYCRNLRLLNRLKEESSG